MPQPVTLFDQNGNRLLIDPTFQADHTSIRPIEYGTTGGAYSLSATSGIMAAGLAGNSPIVGVRWNPSVQSNLCLVRRIFISAGDTATAFTAGVVTFQVFRATLFTAADTAGTQLTLTGMKRRTGFPNSQFAGSSISISSTATLTAGTRTLDANPFGAITSSVTATAGVTVVAPTYLFDSTDGKYPLQLAFNEGYVIQATVPATGTWTFSWGMDWDEVTPNALGVW